MNDDASKNTQKVMIDFKNSFSFAPMRSLESCKLAVNGGLLDQFGRFR
jgi:hypothetical protein